MIGSHLAAQLASDTAGTTGNHDDLAGYLPLDFLSIDFNLFTFQQVLYLYLTHLDALGNAAVVFYQRGDTHVDVLMDTCLDKCAVFVKIVGIDKQNCIDVL